MYGCMYACMDVWMYGMYEYVGYMDACVGCMDAWNIWMSGCMNCLDVWMHGCMDCLDVCVHGCIDTWMYGCMDGCMDRQRRKQSGAWRRGGLARWRYVQATPLTCQTSARDERQSTEQCRHRQLQQQQEQQEQLGQGCSGSGGRSGSSGGRSGSSIGSSGGRGVGRRRGSSGGSSSGSSGEAAKAQSIGYYSRIEKVPVVHQHDS